MSGSMARPSPEQLLKLLKSRRVCRSFTEEPVSDDDVQRARYVVNDAASGLRLTDVHDAITGVSLAAPTSLQPLLDRVATTIRDRQSFAREVKALTARERFSAIVVAGFPFLIVGALSLLLPEMFAVLYTELAGRLILAGAIVMDVIGYLAIKRVAKIDAIQRQYQR